jgi:hypothetical protein
LLSASAGIPLPRLTDALRADRKTLAIVGGARDLAVVLVESQVHAVSGAETWIHCARGAAPQRP